MNFAARFLAFAPSVSLLLFTIPQDLSATTLNLQEEYAELSDNDLDALVALIALYPDALVAQVLGAATYPDQVVEANDFLKGNPDLRGEGTSALRRTAILGSCRPGVHPIPFGPR